MSTIGIRRETKSPWERRVAVVPSLAGELVAAGHRVLVEKAAGRVIPDAEFAAQGCELVDDLPACDVVFGVKEVPIERLQPGACHLYFAHVINGQPSNMPMLQALLDQGATLLDYEKIQDESGRRLVFFGRYAGLAGMLDALWALGQRLEHEGVSPNPFAAIEPAHRYPGLQEALAAVRALGETIAKGGVPAAVSPLIVAVTGTGNVAGGVQEVLAQLPTEEVRPDDLAGLVQGPASPRVVYRVTFSEPDLVRPTEAGAEFQLLDYYQHPERYRGVFADYHAYPSLLVNCIYWDERYPRLVRKSELGQLQRCKVIADISCDVNGSVEATVLATEPGDPCYTYDPAADGPRMGFAGDGPVICAVDILPAELPRDASEGFSQALAPFVQRIAALDASGSLEASGLPPELQRACVVWKGELTPDYAYLREHLKS
ncbi:MAG: bifunctional lysine ketoglutarate reductase /saccharopine dehydrogenase family protein [Planctomycetota bacterium]